jgi:hypothetical protein
MKAKDAERLGLKATDPEVVFIVENQPPHGDSESPAFQKDGRFDPSAYQNFLRSPQASQFLIGLRSRFATSWWNPSSSSKSS